MINKALPQGLYRRLAAYSVSIAFSFGLTLSLYQIYNDYRQQGQRLEQEIQQRVSVVQASAAKAVYEFDEQLGSLVIDAMFEHQAVLEVVIVDDYGDNFLSEARREASSRPVWLPEKLAFEPQELIYTLAILQLSTNQNTSSNSQSFLKVTVDPYLVIGDFVSRSWLILITGILRNTLLAFALLFLSYRLVTRPINGLTQQLSQIDPFKNQDARLSDSKAYKDNELGTLSKMVNTLLDKIQSGLEKTSKLNKELNVEISERIEIETAINYAEKQTAGITGIGYINAMARFLSSSLSIKGVMVAQVEEQNKGQGFHCIAGCYGESEHIDLFIPLNKFSFLDAESDKEFFILTKKENQTADLFFGQHALAIPLKDHNAKLAGMMVLVNEHKLDERFYAQKKPLLQILSSRITSEIEREQQQKTIKFLAHTDALTKLGNRYYFQQYIDDSIADYKNSNKKLALLYLDLDRFKWVNDSFGHTVGDALLVKVAERLKALVPNDGILCRIGGDEFAFLLHIENQGEEHQVAKSIVEYFAEPFIIENHLIITKTSIGISIYPDSAANSQELIKNADIAMYTAKRSHEQRVQYFSHEINQKLQRKIQIENALSDTLKNSELDLVYQPQFNMHSGQLSGVEALVRWNDSELGSISPAEFIPIAEETGLIHQLGQWVTRQACNQAAIWNANGDAPLKVSINFSAPQLKSPLLVSNFLDVVNASQVNPKHIELEITETSLIEDIDATASMLEELSSAGLSISIDDFGTGYSSLRYLKSLPINTLKIDKVFVSEIETDRSNRNIIRAIIALAKAMDMAVIAEGVETKEQLLFLQKHDCDFVQGFYFAKPMRCDEITKMLTSKHTVNLPAANEDKAHVVQS